MTKGIYSTCKAKKIVHINIEHNRCNKTCKEASANEGQNQS